MKKLMLFMLPALLIIISSCNDNMNLEDQNSEYKFQKELTISDAFGNSADLLIQANSQDALNDQTSEVLTLNTSTKDFSKPSSLDTHVSMSNEIDGEDDAVNQNEVFIFVANYKMNPDVTGFNVRSNLELIQSNEVNKRWSKPSYQYAFGSTGVDGVHVEYTGQSCSQEYLNAKLSKKNLGGALWHKLGSEKLSVVGDDWTYDGSYNYNKFRLRVQAKLNCSGTASYSYYWTT